jgi:hypothetical protein
MQRMPALDNMANPASRGPRPSFSIVAIAAFQMLAGLLALTIFAFAVWSLYLSRRVSVPTDAPQVLGALLVIAFLIIVTAIGLWRLRVWARRMSLGLGIVSAGACAVAAIVHQRTPGFDFTPDTLKFALWVLIPVNLWWWIVFTRQRVVAQFH